MYNNTGFINRFIHTEEEFPVLSRQTHFVIKNGKIVAERIGINENLMHYIQDTALLISKIDGSMKGSSGSNTAFDHIVYLDKSARPVSWLVNMLWEDFAAVDGSGQQIKRPHHTYVNIDRSPWFRKVGIDVSDDGRQKSNGELATYADFISHKGNLTKLHLAAIRCLFIEGGIETEDADVIMNTPTILDGRRLLIVDEVARTGATLKIAAFLFKAAIPELADVEGTCFWHRAEPLIKVGSEFMMTSLPVWYDPCTSFGRGIGELNEGYYRRRYEHYLALSQTDDRYDIKKLRMQAFAASVFSAPHLHSDGSIMGLEEEKVSRELTKDLCRLTKAYKDGTVFFTPPAEWGVERCLIEITKQGAVLIPPNATPAEASKIRQSDRFYLNVVQAIKAE